jgi:transcriptional regulator with GAF, ATPase, and Fis domain
MGEQSGLIHLVQLAVAAQGPDALPQRLCRAWAEGLDTDAVGMSLMTHTSYRQLLCASNTTALRLEEIQFTAAQGPCIAAAETGSPVVIRDLTQELTPWPVFGGLLREELPEVRSIYAFPMRAGQMVLGCIDLARTRPGHLGHDLMRQASAAADATAQALLSDPFDLLAAMPAPAPRDADFVREVHWSATARAVGVLAARRGLSVQDALALMRARAFSQGQTLVEITAEILARPADTL